MRFTEFYETIGPHNNQELELMSQGKDVKPAALIFKHELPKWKPSIKQHGWTVTKIKNFANQPSYVVSWDPATGPAIGNLFKEVGAQRPAPLDFHENLGRLLGYSEQDIRDFINQIKSRG